jgi:hypothetical protein
MRVRVEGCEANGRFHFRVTVPTGYRLRYEGTRFRVEGMDWGREQARQALDTLERMGARRRTVRFEHE